MILVLYRWRSLAGFVRKLSPAAGATDMAADYSSRCYNRVCSESGSSQPFFEYRWAYFFDAAYLNSTLWGAAADASAFTSAFDKLPSAAPGKADTGAWAKAARLLLPLCRGESAGTFEVPNSMIR